MLRRIKSAKITHIALCPRGKNQMPVLYKADDGTVQLESLVKASADAGELLSVIYVPNRPDTDGDFADSATIKEMAYEFNRDHRNLDIRHDGKTLDKSRAYLAENFLIARGDERFVGWKDYSGLLVDLTGAWATVIKIDDPVLREEYRAGRWNGVSMFGTASVETVSAKSADERAFERMAQGLGLGSETMNPEQMAALAKSIADGVTVAVAALFKTQKDDEATKAAELKKQADDAAAKAAQADPRPDFKGDPMSKEAREKFLGDMRAWELRKAVSEGKSADEIATLFKALDDVEPSDAEAGINKEMSPEVRDLKRRLFKAEKRSNQGVKGDKGNEPTPSAEGLSKSDEDFAMDIANEVNAGRGIPAPAKS